jgi:hypothetical protein
MPRRPALALLLLLAGCFPFSGVRGSGRATKVSREVAPFNAIHVGGGIHLNVSSGPQAPLIVEADDNLIDLVETTVSSSGELDIHFRTLGLVWSSATVVVTARAPAIRALQASGGSSIEAKLDPAEALELEASGGADLRARSLEIGKLSASGSGGAVLELSGRTDELALEISGGARVRAQQLAARIVRVDGSGGCTGKLRASELIQGSLSGGCSLAVAGKASSRVKTSGGASVDFDPD